MNLQQFVSLLLAAHHVIWGSSSPVNEKNMCARQVVEMNHDFPVGDVELCRKACRDAKNHLLECLDMRAEMYRNVCLGAWECISDAWKEKQRGARTCVQECMGMHTGTRRSLEMRFGYKSILTSRVETCHCIGAGHKKRFVLNRTEERSGKLISASGRGELFGNTMFVFGRRDWCRLCWAQGTVDCSFCRKHFGNAICVCDKTDQHGKACLPACCAFGKKSFGKATCVGFWLVLGAKFPYVPFRPLHGMCAPALHPLRRCCPERVHLAGQPAL